MSVEAIVNWQALMTATLVPPAERLRQVERVRIVRTMSPDAPECECPEFCRIDHDND